MAEKLVDVDETYSLWRYRHLKVVMRIIGQKRGTGGSPRGGWLRALRRAVLFPRLAGRRQGAGARLGRRRGLAAGADRRGLLPRAVGGPDGAPRAPGRPAVTDT